MSFLFLKVFDGVQSEDVVLRGGTRLLHLVQTLHSWELTTLGQDIPIVLTLGRHPKVVIDELDTIG